MAVFNNYVDASVLDNTPASALVTTGAKTVTFLVPFDTVAADDAGSIYRVIKAIPSTAVPISIKIWTDGVTGMSDVDVCVYKTLDEGGDEVGTEVLASTIDLSSAVLKTAAKDGMINITNANHGKALWELAGQSITSRQNYYDIGLKSVADLSEADSIVVEATFAIH